MPRGPRIDEPGFVYHVICRGIERRNIFSDDKDRAEFLSRLSSIAGSDRNQLYAFCLMPNHLHLLIRRLNMSLSTFMSRLLTGYAIYFNRRHRRSGHLFQNRYKSIVVEEDSYLLELIRYIHLNPIRADIVKDLKALSFWPYSGHAVFMGKFKRDWFDSEQVLLLFADKPAVARARLNQFMQEGIIKGKRSELVGGGLKRSLQLEQSCGTNNQPRAYDERILGSGYFVEGVLKKIEGNDTKAQEVELRRLIDTVADYFGLTVPELCTSSKRSPICQARLAVIWLGTKRFGIPAGRLSQTLGISVSTIYKILATGRGEVESSNILLM